MFDGLFAPRYPERRRVVVSTTERVDFRGLLWEETREYLLLKSAEQTTDLGVTLPVPIRIDYDLLIYREKVLCMQIMSGLS